MHPCMHHDGDCFIRVHIVMKPEKTGLLIAICRTFLKEGGILFMLQAIMPCTKKRFGYARP